MSKKIRIAVFHNLDFGGAKVALFQWIYHLKSMGAVTIDYFKYRDVDESVCDLSVLSDRVFAYDPPVSRNGHAPRLAQKIGLFSRMKTTDQKIAADINENNYDLVFVHHSRLLQTPMVLRYLKGKSVYFCHEPYRQGSEFLMHESGTAPSKKILKFLSLLPKAVLDRRNFSKASVVLANSYYSREAILKYYGRSSRVVYLGVDTEVFKPAENTGKENKIVSSGLLLPHKGYELTLEALSLIRQQIRPEFHIYHSRILGSEQESFKKRLLLKSREWGVTLHLQEGRTNEEVARAYNSALLAVYAANLCPFGIVSLEAMSCGTPVIGVKEGGIRETIVDNVTGLLVERHPKAIAKGLEQLITNKEQRERLASNCRPYVEENWSWARSSEKLFQIFNEVVENSSLSTGGWM